MSITEIALKVREAGDDATLDFDFGFQIYTGTDIKVYIITTATGEKTLQEYGVDYTVAITTDGPGGTVSYTVAPASTEESYIVCDIPATQSTTLRTNGKFADGDIEDMVDRLTMLVQQLEEAVSKCMTVAEEQDDPPAMPEFGSTAGYLYYDGVSALSWATPA